MAVLQFSKVVNSLPSTLEANTLYMVKSGTGFDFFATNSTGTIVAYGLNPQAASRSLLAGETTTYRIIQNAFAHYANTYLKTGSLKIALPKTIVAGDSTTGSGTFVSMRFRLWEYGGRGTSWVTVDGYLQSSGSPAANVWSNVNAYIETTNRSSKPIRVRFGIESGNYVLLIEKTTTGTDSQWLYLMCALESLHMSNGGAASTNFNDPAGWVVSYVTDVSAITFYTTVTPSPELLVSDRVSSVTDKTAGQLLIVGYMGLGGTLPTLNNSNIDDPTLVGGSYQVSSTIYSVFPVGFVKGTFRTRPLAVGSGSANAYHELTDTSTSTPRKWERTMLNGVAGTWAEVRNTANLSGTNEIKNGDLSVWSTVANAPPERYGVGPASGATAIPVSTKTAVGVAEAVPFGLKNWWALSTNNGGFYLILPNVRRYAGRTMTFSFYVKADKAGASLAGLRFYQRFGSGGSPSSSTSSYGNADGITVTTAVQRFVCTVTLPSISDKTLGTNDDSDLYISMNLTLGGAVVSMTGFKMEGGVAATPFEMRDEEELLTRGMTLINQAIAGITPSTWIPITFINGFKAFSDTTWGDPPAYRKIGNCIEMRGLVDGSGGSAGAVMFNLPLGYVPPNNVMFPSISDDVLATIRVITDGRVILNTASTGRGFIALHPVKFFTG